MFRSLLLIFLSPLLVSVQEVRAQAGTLDPSFGNGGLTTFDIGVVYDYGQAVAVQPDGRIVMTGFANSTLVLARFLTDGLPDMTFGTQGRVTIPGMLAYGMALQDDGRIVVCGGRNLAGDVDAVVLRFLADGTPDPSFGNGGQVFTGWPATDEHARSVRVHPDGRIITVGGACGDYPECEFLLVRYLADGSPDVSFGDAGFARIDLTPFEELGYGLALRPDGGYLITGQRGTQTGPGMCYMGITDDGSWDTDVAMTSGDGPSWMHEVELLPDGGFLVAGALFNGLENDFALWRFHADGWPDESFGTDGLVVTDFGGTTDNSIALVVQADGRIIQVGTTINAQFGRSIALARFHPDGSLDVGFDGDGKVVTDLGGDEMAFDAALQADGKLVITGYTTIAGDEDLVVARYLTEGAVAVEDAAVPDPMRVQRSPEGIVLSTAEPLTADLRVMDATGRTLLHRAWNGQPLRMDIAVQAVYLVHLRTSSGQWTRRLLLGRD